MFSWQSDRSESKITDYDDHVVVEPPSELDVMRADNLAVALMTATVHDRSLVLDLANVHFIDSAGISVIVEARNRIVELGGELVIRHPRHQARLVLEMSKLSGCSLIEE